MSNLDDLLRNTYPASYNGIPFLYESDTMESGKQTVTHHYPYKTYAYTEELGQRLRTFTIKAIVTGDDYEFRRDALIAALRINGVGILIHHFYGMISVVCTGFNVSHGTTEIGISRFDITFEESLNGIFPFSIGTTSSTIINAVSAFINSMNLNVTNNFTMNHQTNIQDSANKCFSFNRALKSNVVNATNIDENSLNSFSDLSTTFDNNVYFNVQNPSSLGDAITSLILGYNEIASSFVQAYFLNVAPFGFGKLDKYINYGTFTSDEEINNAKILNSTINGTLLTQMYKNSVLITYENDQELNYIATDLESRYQYFIANNNFDSLLIRQLQDLRTGVREFLNQTKVTVSKVVEVEVSQQPLTDLLYTYYEDFSFENEIIQLNSLKDVTVINDTVKMVTIN